PGARWRPGRWPGERRRGVHPAWRPRAPAQELGRVRAWAACSGSAVGSPRKVRTFRRACQIVKSAPAPTVLVRCVVGVTMRAYFLAATWNRGPATTSPWRTPPGTCAATRRDPMSANAPKDPQAEATPNPDDPLALAELFH